MNHRQILVKVGEVLSEIRKQEVIVEEIRQNERLKTREFNIVNIALYDRIITKEKFEDF